MIQFGKCTSESENLLRAVWKVCEDPDEEVADVRAAAAWAAFAAGTSSSWKKHFTDYWLEF